MAPKTSAKNNKKVASKKAEEQKTVTPVTDIPEKRIQSAISGLEKYLQKEDTEEKVNEKTGKFKLLDDDEDELKDKLQLILVNNLPFNEDTDIAKTKKAVFKPLTIATETGVHSYINDFKKILLILNDSIKFNVDKEDSESEIYKLINDEKIPIGEIITAKQLKTLYKPFENRRKLFSEHSYILCDDSVVTLMPKLLGGKAFNQISTTPVPIRVRNSVKTLSTSVRNFWNNKTVSKYPNGSTLNINLGNLLNYSSESSKKDLLKNIQVIAKQFVDKYMIRSIFLKTNFSPVVPLFYNEKSLQELIQLKEEASSKDETKKVIKNTVEINGVEVELNAFNRALYEIANPEEMETIFSKQLKSANQKRTKSEADKEEEEQKEEKPIKKQKKNAQKA
ncbi:hypothetical protein ACO0SA_003243 [Hanseniaspora valbyensis]